MWKENENFYVLQEKEEHIYTHIEQMSKTAKEKHGRKKNNKKDVINAKKGQRHTVKMM